GFTVIQDGFAKDRFEVLITELPRLLKSLIKKEFPRSNKIRLYAVDSGGREIPRKI
ncbi:MAG: hypothetical protein HQL68_11295, partial [Magnetococcales bacterium]|nr:hypothetical protein [Magnetococcales bacterium]